MGGRGGGGGQRGNKEGKERSGGKTVRVCLP